MTGLGGLPARRPDQSNTGTPAVGVQPGSAAGVVHARQVIIAASNAGIFVYSPSAGAGNLIGSWASSAGTDSYTNSYPQGLSVDIGSISGDLISGGTITGSTISGGTITGTVFNGTTFQLNSAGFFLYSGAPAAGNLIASIASSAGTDSHGNSYLSGLLSYSGSAVSQLISGTLQTGITTDVSLGLVSGGSGQMGISSGTRNTTPADSAGSLFVLSSQAFTNPRPGSPLVNVTAAGGIRAPAFILNPQPLQPVGYPLATDPFTGSSWGVGERNYINNTVNAFNDLVGKLITAGLIS